MTIKNSNDDYVDLLAKQHEYIADSLREKHFVEYIKKQSKYYDRDKKRDIRLKTYEKAILPRYLELVLASYGKTCKTINKDLGYPDSYSANVSACTKPLNWFLEEFSTNEHIDPPIQLFFSHKVQNDDVDPVGCHLACAKTGTQKNNKKYSYGVVSFEEAKENGKRKAQAASQKPVSPNSQIEEFRERLRNEAYRHLIKEKLHDRGRDDYRSLDLEIGLLEESRREKDGFRPEPADHNRAWDEFDYRQLMPPHGVYILSSETGAGKTSFLRNLQLEIIKEKDSIPLFLAASVLDEEADFGNRNKENFLESVSKYFKGYLQDGNERKFLKDHDDKIIFLIDGLDQISGTGTEYRLLVDKLLGTIEDKLIITSRPFAAVEKERDSRIDFLRLKPFSEESTEIYFAESYRRAKELCKTCPGMIRMPMLAYMVRCLIEEGRDRNVKNRSDLYKAFIDHVLSGGHTHDNLKMPTDRDTEVRNALGALSYGAIANPEYFLQRIPLSSATDSLPSNIKMDDLLKYGLVNLIANRLRGIDKYLYFSHQSFQEYLAAEYIAQSNERVEQVLGEKWNPKWKEVIKFLAGIKGQEIIEQILSEKDNPIHSKLFLSAELVPEAKTTAVVKNKILQQVKSLLDCPPFSKDAGMYLAYVDEIKVIDKRVSQPKEKRTICPSKINVIKLKDKLDRKGEKQTAERLIEMLEDKRTWFVAMVMQTFETAPYGDEVHAKVVKKLAEKLKDKDASIRRGAGDALGELKDNVSKEVMKMIVSHLEDKDKGVVCSTILTLIKLKDRDEIDSKVVKTIIGKLDDTNKGVVLTSVYAVGKLKDRDEIDSKVVKTIIGKLDDTNKDIVTIVVDALTDLKDRDEIDSQAIKKIAGKLEDDNQDVQAAAYEFLKVSYQDGRLEFLDI